MSKECAECKNPQVWMEIDRLRNLIAQVNTNTIELEKHLGCVMSSPLVHCEEPKKVSPPLCELANAINTQFHMIEAINLRIHDTLRRLEV